jgi:hypothetical protein
MMDGWRWREERAHQRDAWLLANLLQPHSKRRLKPAMFLGTPDDKNVGALWDRIVERKVKAGEWH